ncbi:unnamed protein product [Rotaria sp. Silwood2]|nr:unnamed protein product [Rotaria sp. Silwood2]
MYSVSPSDVERYHLRLLLLYTPGACSCDDLKTVDGQVCQTFMEAAKRRGLLCDDTEYERCMSEAVIFRMPQQLRTLFCVILLYCNPTRPVDLWNSFKAHMAEDFMQPVDSETAEAMEFYAIDAKLKEQGRSCSDFDIPSPTSVPYSFESKIINKEEELRMGQEMYAMLNQDQRSIADTILASHRTQSTTTADSCFFTDGPGGQGIYVMTVAWTGIAASLLPEGRTVHSRFKLPVPILKTSTSSIRPNNEAPMAPCYALNAVDILLRDIMNIDAPFGGKIMILGGDFRQVLPVIRLANRSELIAASLKSSNLWPYFKVIHLHQNMRTGPGEEEFSKSLIKLGNGELTSNEDDEIELPSSYVPTLCNRTILCPKNEHSLLVNEEALQRLPETEKTYTSVDEVECEDGDDITNYPTEVLNSRTPSGMPPHKLKLKIGAIVMLLRNLDVHQGLCNGI